MTYCVAECKRRGVWYINTNAAESTASMFRRVTPKRQLIAPPPRSKERRIQEHVLRRRKQMLLTL